MTRDAMIQLFGVEQFGDPTQVGFNRKAFVPRPTLTEFDVTRRRVFFPKALIGQRNRFTIIAAGEGPEGIVVLIGRQPTPIDDLALVVDQPGQLDADNPAPVRFAFPPDLLRPAPLTT